MANKAEIQQRVRRLLDGERQLRDLDRIFSWLRFRSFGHKGVRDIADFAAHPERRDQGVAWTTVQSYAGILDYHLPRIAAHNRGPMPASDKAALERATLSALNLDPPEDVRQRTGLGKDRVKARLKSALSKIASYDGRSIETIASLSDEEKTTLDYYATRLPAFPLLTEETLFSELFQCLVKNSLMLSGEKGKMIEQKQFIALYAIEKMHLTQVVINNEVNATLSAHICDDTPPARLSVFASLPYKYNGIEVGHSFPVFDTSCLAAEWCKPEILGSPYQRKALDMPLEVGLDCKLGPVT